MASVRPTIVLIQGSFQLPPIYADLVQALEAKGYEVVYPHLPSMVNQDDPDFATRDLSDDAAAVEAELKKLIEEQDKNIVVLMHSYGGLVGCEAIPEDLTHSSRKAKGLAGGVIYGIFFAAFLLDVGQSVLGAFGESPNVELLENGRFVIKNPKQLLYSGLSEADAEKWSAYVVPQSHAVESTVLTRASYKHVPSAYIVCTEDQACPPRFQQMFAAQAKAKVLEIVSGHSPHLSHLDELVDDIDTLVKGI